MNSKQDDEGGWTIDEESVPSSDGMGLHIPEDVEDPSLWKRAATFQLIYSLCGLVLGLACIVGGIVLFLHGVTGSTSWTAKIIGAESDLSDAGPGTILFVVGLFVVIVTRYSVKAK